jgi:hypothetical protein
LTEEKEDGRPILLSESEVWDIIEFAQSQVGWQNIFTPDLLNARMRDVTMNPMLPTDKTLEDALKNPKESERALKAFAESFELTSMPYKRMLAYLANMPAFDLTYTCTNAKASDYKSPAYKKDLDVVFDFLDRFDAKTEFRVAIKQMLRDEAFFCVLRDEGNKFVLQELPANYCKITGRFEQGLLFSFDLNWFLQPAVSLDMYPDFFKEKYSEYFRGKNNGIQAYNPGIPLADRGDNTWVYWVDTSPMDNFWAWKFTPEIATRVPYFTPMFADLILQPLVRTLQKNQYIAAAQKIIFGEVGMLNKDAKATVRDSISISPELLGKFIALMRRGISSEVVNIASAPLQNVQPITFPLDTSSAKMYDDYLKTAVAASGVNSNLIFSSNIKPNTVETQLSLNADEQIVEALYPSFESFLDFHINKRTKKYKFKCRLEGSNFYTSRSERLEKAHALADKGIVLPQKFAAALGMMPQEMQRQMEEAKANGWVDLLTPIVSSFNMPKESGAGRPQKKDGDLTTSGSDTRDAGSNLEKGGKV